MSKCRPPSTTAPPYAARRRPRPRRRAKRRGPRRLLVGHRPVAGKAQQLDVGIEFGGKRRIPLPQHQHLDLDDFAFVRDRFAEAAGLHVHADQRLQSPQQLARRRRQFGAPDGERAHQHVFRLEAAIQGDISDSGAGQRPAEGPVARPIRHRTNADDPLELHHGLAVTLLRKQHVA